MTHDQTRYIFETNTIGITDSAVNIDDIVETANHFKCIDTVIDNAAKPLSETFIKQLHLTLKTVQATHEKIGLLSAIIKNIQMKSAEKLPSYQRKFPKVLNF